MKISTPVLAEGCCPHFGAAVGQAGITSFRIFCRRRLKMRTQYRLLLLLVVGFRIFCGALLFNALSYIFEYLQFREPLGSCRPYFY